MGCGNGAEKGGEIERYKCWRRCDNERMEAGIYGGGSTGCLKTILLWRCGDWTGG